VFHPLSIRSLEGKPLVDDHPDDTVDPGNVAEHQIGHVYNVRRGTGDASDLLLADVLVTSRRGIDAILGSKKQISVGYDAAYKRTGRTPHARPAFATITSRWSTWDGAESGAALETGR
jgi:hypothetical protein